MIVGSQHFAAACTSLKAQPSYFSRDRFQHLVRASSEEALLMTGRQDSSESTKSETSNDRMGKLALGHGSDKTDHTTNLYSISTYLNCCFNIWHIRKIICHQFNLQKADLQISVIPRWSHVFSFSSPSLTRPESAIGPSPGSKTSGHFAWRRGGLKHNLAPKTPWKNPLSR